jgi:hypothetical protein
VSVGLYVLSPEAATDAQHNPTCYFTPGDDWQHAGLALLAVLESLRAHGHRAAAPSCGMFLREDAVSLCVAETSCRYLRLPIFREEVAMANESRSTSKDVKSAMHRRKAGTLKSGRSGKTVKSKKQAIAIVLSEARANKKVPRKASQLGHRLAN